MSFRLFVFLTLLSVVSVRCANQGVTSSQAEGSDAKVEETDSGVRVSNTENSRPFEAPDEPVLMTSASSDYEAFIAAVNQSDQKKIERLAAEILAKKPNDPMVLNGLAHYHRRSGRNRMAEILIKKVLDKNPNDLRAKRNLAMIYYQKGEIGRALSELNKIYEKDKNFPGVAFNLASIYHSSGVYDVSEALFESIYDNGSSVAVSAGYGQALASNAKYEQALGIFIKAIRKFGLSEIEAKGTGKAVIDGYLRVLELQPNFVARETTLLQDIIDSLDKDFSGRARKILEKGEKVGATNP